MGLRALQSGLEKILTAVGFILAILAILVAVTALPVGDTFLWLVTLELKPVTPSTLGWSGGSSSVCQKKKYIYIQLLFNMEGACQEEQPFNYWMCQGSAGCRNCRAGYRTQAPASYTEKAGRTPHLVLFLTVSHHRLTYKNLFKDICMGKKKGKQAEEAK